MIKFQSGQDPNVTSFKYLFQGAALSHLEIPSSQQTSTSSVPASAPPGAVESGTLISSSSTTNVDRER